MDFCFAKVGTGILLLCVVSSVVRCQSTTTAIPSSSLDECSRSDTLIPSGSDITINGTILQAPNTTGTWFWTITSPNGSSISLEFICDFYIPKDTAGSFCLDQLNIYPGTLEAIGDTICGEKPSAPIIISDNKASIMFSTFSENLEFFMKVTFITLDKNDTDTNSSECSIPSGQSSHSDITTIRPQSFAFSSGNYLPSSIEKYSQLFPVGKFIYVEFLCDFYIQGSPGSCNDTLTLSNSDIGYFRAICGNDRPTPFYVESNWLDIEFITDSSVEGFGFAMRLTAVDPIEHTDEFVTRDTITTVDIDDYDYSYGGHTDFTAEVPGVSAAASDADDPSTNAATDFTTARTDTIGIVSTTQSGPDSSLEIIIPVASAAVVLAIGLALLFAFFFG